MKSQQVLYYQKRAKEYELVYEKPERQQDLSSLKSYLGQQFTNKSIIEIACGTGYWTEVLAHSAKAIMASDINTEVLTIAEQKNYPSTKVTFKVQAIEDLEHKQDSFDGLFGGFIWSHIKKEELPSFIATALNQVQEGAELIFIDNKFVPGSSSPITRTDAKGNTFQTRTLNSGEQYEVVKNFPEPEATQKMINKVAEGFEWIDFEYFWILKFRKRKSLL